jgi:hypothetical protein
VPNHAPTQYLPLRPNSQPHLHTTHTAIPSKPDKRFQHDVKHKTYDAKTIVVGQRGYHRCQGHERTRRVLGCNTKERKGQQTLVADVYLPTFGGTPNTASAPDGVVGPDQAGNTERAGGYDISDAGSLEDTRLIATDRQARASDHFRTAKGLFRNSARMEIGEGNSCVKQVWADPAPIKAYLLDFHGFCIRNPLGSKPCRLHPAPSAIYKFADSPTPRFVSRTT